MEYVKKLFFLLGEQKRKLPLLVFLFICISLLELAGIGMIGPYVSIIVSPESLEGSLGNVINYLGLPTGREELLLVLGFILLGIFFIKAVSAILINQFVISFAAQLQVKLRSSLMEAYQAMPYSHYLSRNSSEFIYSIQVLVGTAQAVTISALKLLSDLIVITAIISLLAYQNFIAVLGLLILITILIFFYDRMFKVNLTVYGEKTNEASTHLVKSLNQALLGFKEIRILGKEVLFFKKVLSSANQLAFYQTREALIATAPRFLLEFIMILFVISLVLGTILLQQNLDLLVVTLAMFSVAAIRLLPAASSVSQNIATFRFSRDAIFRLYKDFKLTESFKNKKQVKKEGDKLTSFKKIRLTDVSFSYPNTPNKILEEISFQINLGDCIGIIGPSGSGKTTLVDLLLGLLDYQEGSIAYNGKLFDSELENWQSKVAYLPQEVFIMDETFRSNIALATDETKIDDLKVIKSLKKARLKDFLDQLPHGLNTTLGERGMRLSGGQRQRVALARAFYHEREVLVLDEATSSLDNETEKQIVDEIRHLKGNTTMLVVAHRLSTLQYCDLIYELKEGRFIRSGSPQEMLNLKKV